MTIKTQSAKEKAKDIMKSPKKPGKVYLVGAGPGDPGLITVRGMDLLTKAEVIIHDQLGAPSFLPLASQNSELIDVGKRAGNHAYSQDEINALLVKKAREGKTVVRLKGGDPLMFGRGGEEMQVLSEAGIQFEVVPGVTSALAAPAYSGIPITHRSCTSVMAVATGHEADLKRKSSIPWPSLASIGSIVFLMGLKNIEKIASNLIAVGKPPTTPVAVIEQATMPNQRIVIGTLTDIALKVITAEITPPAVIVVGEVVSFSKTLSWFDKRPLFGRTIVVTRSRAQAGEFSKKLLELGALVLECPTIRIERIKKNAEFDKFFKNFDHYDDFVFTSVNGVEGFVENILNRKKDLRILSGKRIICIGPATAERFTKRGITPDFIPETYVAESLIPFFKTGKPRKVVIFRAEQAREILPETLAKMGFDVSVIPLYRTLKDHPDDDKIIELLKAGQVSAVTFTSSSTVDRFMEVIKGNGIKPAAIPGIAIGPVTADTCKKAGINLLATASKFTIDGLTDCLLDIFQNTSFKTIEAHNG